MTIDVEVDDDLMLAAREFTGLADDTALINVALKALIEREAARRLAALGGTMPDFRAAPRRRLKWVRKKLCCVDYMEALLELGTFAV